MNNLSNVVINQQCFPYPVKCLLNLFLTHFQCHALYRNLALIFKDSVAYILKNPTAWFYLKVGTFTKGKPAKTIGSLDIEGVQNFLESNTAQNRDQI